MGSHVMIILSAFQNGIGGFIRAGWSCARVQPPGFTGPSLNQMPLTRMRRSPAGTGSRHSCGEDLGEQGTCQGREISGTILD